MPPYSFDDSADFTMNPIDYRLPAEWERQSALLLAWPFAGSDWNDLLALVQDEYAALIETALRYQPVILLSPPGDGSARTRLGTIGESPGFSLIEVRYNDTWCRDYGPITLCHAGRRLALDFHFDGWGGRHEARLDNRVNGHLARHALFSAIDFRQSLFELEGGAIESDGASTLLINRHCMRARHPYLDDSEVDHELKSWLNIEHLIEIDMPPIDGDDTDGHIDTLVRFAGPKTLVFQSLRDPADTQKLTGQLEALRDRSGRPFELFALPCPDDLEAGIGASYANFIVINGAVLVPRFGSRADRAALDVLGARFADRKIETVDARALVSQGGGPHCASMQIPDRLA